MPAVARHRQRLEVEDIQRAIGNDHNASAARNRGRHRLHQLLEQRVASPALCSERVGQRGHNRVSILFNQRLDSSSIRLERDEPNPIARHEPRVRSRRSDPIEDKDASHLLRRTTEHGRRRPRRRRHTMTVALASAMEMVMSVASRGSGSGGPTSADWRADPLQRIRI